MATTAFTFARSANLQVLQAAKEHQLDAIPEGFNNSIRWNAGHVLVIAENVLSHSDHYEPVLPSLYKTLFDMGTSPSGWTEEPPSVVEIVEMSKKQLEAVQKLSQNYGDTTFSKPFVLFGTSFDNVSDAVGFISFHEGLHFTAIKSLLKKTK
ncbi:DinB family protein [Alkalihalobacterium alkalinitrilicum]|uniref:DinB family protein n=1 Tax=Alkalihalobacterium alkalinitrilicum TaxID=427920 RepID=UPI000994C8AB|nr:DinB family protein [Alkalihalobacterium alkalinitrilicum]